MLSVCIFLLNRQSVFFFLLLSTDKLRLPFRFVEFAYLLQLIFAAFETLSAYRFMKYSGCGKPASNYCSAFTHGINQFTFGFCIASFSLSFRCFLSFDLSSQSNNIHSSTQLYIPKTIEFRIIEIRIYMFRMLTKDWCWL